MSTTACPHPSHLALATQSRYSRPMTVSAKTTYIVEARRSGKWWAIEVPNLHGCFTQAHKKKQIDAQARDLISLMLEVMPDSFDLEIWIRIYP